MSVLRIFFILCLVSICCGCDDWLRVQVAINEWYGELNVITDLSHNNANLLLLFGDYADRRSTNALMVENNLMDIKLLGEYDDYGTPVLRGVMINGVDICDKSSASVVDFKPQIPQHQVSPVMPSVTTPTYEFPRVTYTIPDECGITIPDIVSYIHHGFRATVSEFPWHAVIFDMPIWKYRCGGSLISRNLVVTAAHCVTYSQSNYPLPQSSFVLVLGKDQLRTSSITEQTSYVAEIHVHNKFNPDNFNNDIAVIKLDTEMHYTNFVRPVCIWPYTNDRLDSVVNQYGSIPGFGYNEHWQLPDHLNSVNMPVVSYETCLSTYRDFYARVISTTNFCAGSRNGSSVCNGDSGGGMVFKINSLYYLRGIVSIGPSKQHDRTQCSTDDYIIFTDVAKYVDWLRQF